MYSVFELLGSFGYAGDNLIVCSSNININSTCMLSISLQSHRLIHLINADQR
jgi:hypothetical protein